MRRLGVLFIILLSALSITLLLCSCDDADTQEVFQIEYVASEGGTISGSITQKQDIPFTSSEVCAEPSEGYVFVSWDDGVTTQKRTDYVDGEKRVSAIFKRTYLIEFDCNINHGVVFGITKQRVTEGELCDSVFASPMVGYRFSHWSNGEANTTLSVTATRDEKIEAIFVREDKSLPILSINTENSADIVSKSEYLNCDISVSNTSDEYKLEGVDARIRGRGNSTWEYDKKPYKIKFNSGVDLFGNGKAKDWTLISNHSDLSLARNYLAQSVASLFDSVNMTSSVQYVELFINGKYLGVYLVCEQIEIQRNRIDISEGADLDTGYLVELDGHANGHFQIDNIGYTVNKPDKDDEFFTPEHLSFIESYIMQCADAVTGDNYEAVKELIDVESFAEAYIVYELFKCVDAGYSSFFMYKDAGDKLYCGPVWDFDRSLGIVGHRKEAKNYDTLWARQENFWFRNLLEFEEFHQLVSKKLAESTERIESTLDECYDYLYDNRDSFDRNFEKWRILGTFVWPNDDELTALKTWDAQLEYTRTYLKNSLNFMLSIYNE